MASLVIQSIKDPVHKFFYSDRISFHCSQIWDTRNARFTPCALPFISAFPAGVAIIALVIAFVEAASLRFPTPQWLRPFFREPEIPQRGMTVRQRYYVCRPTYALLLLSILGLASQIAVGVYPAIRKDAIFPAASWLAQCAILLIEFPVSTPYKVLLMHFSIIVTQTIIIVDDILLRDERQDSVFLLFVGIGVASALASVAVIFLMPMRDPLLYKDDISVPFTPPSSEFRTPEDNLTLWQWTAVTWVEPLLSLAQKQDLNNETVWDLGYEFKHSLLHENFRKVKGTVFRRLMIANGLDIIITCVLGVIKTLSYLMYPVLLQRILSSMRDDQVSREATLRYAIMSFSNQLFANQVDLFSLWYQRRAYERSRGEMITMLYEKSLSRKVVSMNSKPDEEPKPMNGNGVAKSVKKTKLQEVRGFISKLFKRKQVESKEELAAEKAKDMASTGKIMNLMRGDAYEVAQLIWDFNYVVRRPVGLVVCVILIWQLIGWPCLIGVITVLIAQVINALLGKASLRWSRDRRTATDNKLHKISQVVESIRHLRWYGWEDVWLDRIMDARGKELHLRVIVYLWNVAIAFVSRFASGMFPVVAFYGYTIFAGKPLTVDIAFPALQLFAVLEGALEDIPYFITAILNAWVAMGRIEEFMLEPDKENAEEDLLSTGTITLEKASFAWPGSTSPTLHEISLQFWTGLNLVCGEVGAGKSALLLAVLGEMDLLEGVYHRNSEAIGFCGAPWLQSMSIRDNILFSAPFDETRYRAVLEACALVPDMAEFKSGDLSLIGENGVGLSGGQRARVSLARAVYSSAKILLLDDPLAALDHQTADWIVSKCFKGPLLEGRTVVLVTHRIGLCLGVADQAFEISVDGRARILEPKTSPYLETHSTTTPDNEETERKENEQKSDATPEKFMEEERKSRGGVRLAVYWEYIKAAKLRWWIALIIVLAVLRLIDVGETWFLKQWGEAYGGRPAKGPFGNLPSPDVNIKPWLVGFFLLAAATSVAGIISQTFMLVIVYKSGKNLFARVMRKCVHATFRFYDVTPVGMLMNRLTSDINTVDGDISRQFQSMATLGIAWVSSLVIIASITPLFLLFSIILTITFVAFFTHFLPSSQSLRRLEMVSLTPLISNFGEVTAGLTTIRAYGAAARFQNRVISVTDNFQKMDHFYWSVQAWLMLRFENVSAIATFVVTTTALYTGVSAGLTAFVLTASNRFVSSTRRMCREYGKLQMEFVSVERVVELLDLDQESEGQIDPPAWWPSLGGDIVFEEVTIRYAAHLDPALDDINLTIKGGSTTALIGRTGSGKSTLALSILATTPPSQGRILIDGIDISKVSKQTLRQRITFLAQDPVLFPGTMRENLDPLNAYSDEECVGVLSKIADRHQWSLETKIDTGGRNLSQGQRQLVGLARALLRRSPIIIMDEATASIDMETSMRIQEILREEMKSSTVVTIAHRVEAVRDAQRCVVLGKGKVIEEGAAGEIGKLMA